jgi:hypothetical protein
MPHATREGVIGGARVTKRHPAHDPLTAARRNAKRAIARV